MMDTRTSKRGRTPSLRDEILNLLACSGKAMTLKEIAEHVHRDETTPFRPLKDLKLMGLVESDNTGDTTLYSIVVEKYDEMAKLG
jgi:DNA-binding IclR family transcriptional regulator